MVAREGEEEDQDVLSIRFVASNKANQRRIDFLDRVSSLEIKEAVELLS